MNPKVTVYIPTRNRRFLLQEAVESVFEQTYSDWQLIVVDDCSQDDTLDYLASIERDKRVVVLKNDKPLGACASRNYALEVCQTEYITGLDDDDLFLPERISTLMEEYDPKYSFVCDRLQPRLAARARRKIPLNKLLHRNCVGNQVFAQTDRLRSIGGFNTKYPSLQDYDAWVRLVNEYGPCLQINTNTYVHREKASKSRISTDKIAKATGFSQFFLEHGHMMSDKHRLSHDIVRDLEVEGVISPVYWLRFPNFAVWHLLLNNIGIGRK